MTYTDATGGGKVDGINIVINDDLEPELAEQRRQRRAQGGIK